MANADGYVLPKPGIPKTLGIINIIFGILGLSCGISGLGGMLLLPAGMEFIEKTAKEAQSKQADVEKAQLKAIDDRIAAAKNDEEKQAIEKERADTAANQVKITPVDLSAATDVLKNPTIMAFSYASLITSLLLSIAALAAGIGLVRLKGWGRSLALWEAGLRIVQVVGFLVIQIVVILPISQANNDKQIAKLQEAANAPGAGQAEATALNMTKTMSGMAAPLAAVQSLPWTIYPIVLLILLNTQGAKAACGPRKIENIDDL